MFHLIVVDFRRCIYIYISAYDKGLMPLEKRKRKTVKPLWWKPYGFRKQFSFSSRFLRPRSVLALTLSQTKSVHYLPDLWFVPLCILYKVSTTKPDHHGNSITAPAGATVTSSCCRRSAADVLLPTFCCRQSTHCFHPKLKKCSFNILMCYKGACYHSAGRRDRDL